MLLSKLFKTCLSLQLNTILFKTWLILGSKRGLKKKTHAKEVREKLSIIHKALYYPTMIFVSDESLLTQSSLIVCEIIL